LRSRCCKRLFSTDMLFLFTWRWREPVTVADVTRALAGEHVVVSSSPEDAPTNVSAAGQGDILVSISADANQKNGRVALGHDGQPAAGGVDCRGMRRDHDGIASSGSDSMKVRVIVLAVAVGAAVTLDLIGCGYHTARSASALPQNVRTVAIPGFVSHSRRSGGATADRCRGARIQCSDAVPCAGTMRKTTRMPVLRATVLSATAAPLVYDSTTGRAVSALVTVSVQVVMTDRRGRYCSRILPIFSRAVRNLERSAQFFFRKILRDRSRVTGFRAYPGGQYPGGLLMAGG